MVVTLLMKCSWSARLKIGFHAYPSQRIVKPALDYQKYVRLNTQRDATKTVLSVPTPPHGHSPLLARSGTSATPATLLPRPFPSTQSRASPRLSSGPASTIPAARTRLPSRDPPNRPAAIPAPERPPCTCRCTENSRRTKTRKTRPPKSRAAKRNKRHKAAEQSAPPAFRP